MSKPPRSGWLGDWLCIAVKSLPKELTAGPARHQKASSAISCKLASTLELTADSRPSSMLLNINDIDCTWGCRTDAPPGSGQSVAINFHCIPILAGQKGSYRSMLQ